jgi:hypothetical protein
VLQEKASLALDHGGKDLLQKQKSETHAHFDQSKILSSFELVGRIAGTIIMTFQEEAKIQLAQNFIQNFHSRAKTLHQYLLCGDLLSSTLLLTIPAPISLTPIACTTEFQLKSAKNQLKF